ncbi:MAG: hypothetical protein VKL59_19015 [Nostocaceae cyanobacterium]|nr:hypothetical protein [Nostocaceae cyanobacterium]
MILWKQLRIIFLVITLGGVLSILCKVILMKDIPKHQGETPAGATRYQVREHA